MYINKIMTDCAHFNGYKPCKFIKEKNAICNPKCEDYEKIEKKILIIKRRAGGEVIRNTPILHKLKKKGNFIVWLTDYPELIPRTYVNMILKYNIDSVLTLKAMHFDIIYSLDKDRESCALAGILSSDSKKGFKIGESGNVLPFDDDAEHLWRKGIDDDYMKNDKMHYVEEIFKTCGFEFSGEKYILPEFKKNTSLATKGKIRVGLNTGVGNIWPTRLYSEKNWTIIASELIEKEYEVIILGGPQEDVMNERIAKNSGAKYFGVKPMVEFIEIVNMCDIVVTCVTFCLHVSIGLGKYVILLNNIFNKSEFYLYGNGVILEPELGCKMCYKTKFDDKCESENCMDLINPKSIMDQIYKEYPNTISGKKHEKK